MQQIDASLELAIKLIKSNSERFEFQNGRDYYYMPYSEIIYFESNGRKIKIVTMKTEQEFYGVIKDLKKRLPKEFFPIHQSYVINETHVVRYAYDMVEMNNNTILSISKSFRKQVRERLLKG